MTRICIYGDVSPNIIDGSSIWLVSIASVLANIVEEVHIQLKAALSNRILITSLDKIPNIRVYEPNQIDNTRTGELTPSEAVAEVERRHQDLKYDALIVRGFEACNQFSRSGALSPILWSYIIDVPYPPHLLSTTGANRLTRIATRSRRMFAQTEAARSYLEAIAPNAAGKTLLLPPMIPEEAFIPRTDNGRNRNGRTKQSDTLKLVYSGKFVKDWRTLEILELPKLLAARGLPTELHILENKFNRSPKDKAWVPRMQAALQLANDDPQSGVTWYGAVSRAKSLSIIRSADIGLGWRTNELDGSLEISTKALEYSAAGTPPLINKTEDHIQLFGKNYPLFAEGDWTLDRVADQILATHRDLRDASNTALRVAQDFSMGVAENRLKKYFTRAGVFTSPGNGLQVAPRTKVLIASHDLKFLGELMDHLSSSPRFELNLDAWATLREHDEQVGQQGLAWADTVLCEWAGPSLVWYSERVRPGQRLVCRLHRFEIDNNAPWMEDVVWENVDTMIFVSELYRRKALNKYPLRPEQCVVIPNAVDSLDFDRPKTESARFTLGLVGIVPLHKRPDRAISFLESLLQYDHRYILHIKSRMPWEYPYEWEKSIQKQAYLELFAKIAYDSLLSKHVVFDAFSPGIASWHRNIGFILSPSEVESFHMAPAEGMSARTVPIFWDRPGVDEIFGEEFMHPTIDSAKEMVLAARDPEMFARLGERARSSVYRWDPTELMPMWEVVLAAGNNDSLIPAPLTGKPLMTTYAEN